MSPLHKDSKIIFVMDNLQKDNPLGLLIFQSVRVNKRYHLIIFIENRDRFLYELVNNSGYKEFKKSV
jgi:hypothetical protein